MNSFFAGGIGDRALAEAAQTVGLQLFTPSGVPLLAISFAFIAVLFGLAWLLSFRKPKRRTELSALFLVLFAAFIGWQYSKPSFEPYQESARTDSSNLLHAGASRGDVQRALFGCTHLKQTYGDDWLCGAGGGLEVISALEATQIRLMSGTVALALSEEKCLWVDHLMGPVVCGNGTGTPKAYRTLFEYSLDKLPDLAAKTQACTRAADARGFEHNSNGGYSDVPLMSVDTPVRALWAPNTNPFECFAVGTIRYPYELQRLAGKMAKDALVAARATVPPQPAAQ